MTRNRTASSLRLFAGSILNMSGAAGTSSERKRRRSLGRSILMATFPITEDKIFLPPQQNSAADRRRRARRSIGIMEEHHFLHMLCLERKRTERSGNPFMLMLLSARGKFQAADGEKLVRQIVSALSLATRETDTLGWYEYGSTLAVLFPEIGPPEENAKLIIAKVSTALQKTLGLEQFDAISISFRIFPTREPEQDDVDLIFYPDSSDRHNPKRGARILKRSIDVICSLMILAVLWPVLLIIAALVKFTSEGSILFRQRRVGLYGTSFTFLKFRSMYSNNDPKIHQEYVSQLINGQADHAKSGQPGVYKLTNDPRVTPLGRFLRKTSLDELPQLFNVLKGEMSLVGPRPPVPYEFEQYDIWHRRRVVEVKPGITGLWQVTGRSKTTFDDMVRLDLKYAKIWSVWLDLKILLLTPMAVVSGEGAY